MDNDRTNYQVTEVVRSVADFIAFVEEHKRAEMKSDNKADFIFRGHRCDDWKLHPKFDRVEWNGGREKLEQLILNEFARTAPFSLGTAMDDPWERMAIAQHHGLPTRLLDWTYSATAALWFAVKDDAKKQNEISQDGAVWILKTNPDDFIDYENRPATPFDGYTVSVHRVPTSLLGGTSAFVEMHAIDLRSDPPGQYIVRIDAGEKGEIDYRCACELAMVAGIDLSAM